MKRVNNHFSPEHITELSRCEIFVFGSNLQGQHMGGAARAAYEKFGAQWGVGNGPTGRCYAIPTMHGGLEEIRPYVDEFIAYAKAHPMNRFLLTRIGCGIAGFKDNEMARLFIETRNMANVAIPREWFPVMAAGYDMGVPQRGKEKAPKVITDKIIEELCQKYLYDIGAGIHNYIPDVQIRYVRDTNDFGYANLEDCFFFGTGEMYVWESDEKWAADHNQDVVDAVFQDECYGRGYAHRVIFAGVNTHERDSNGDEIYTGDVIQVLEEHYRMELALGAFEDGYRFILDNHSLLLSDCNDRLLTRIGTVFYQLDANEYPVTINNRTMDFNGWRDTQEEHQLKVLMSKYTPNFAQEIWKYQGNEILGIEFKWDR